MKLTNDCYVILMGTPNFTERYFRDETGWQKVSSRGRTFPMTAEQVLNHLLPALAGMKRGLSVEVQHREAPTAKLRKPKPGATSGVSVSADLCLGGGADPEDHGRATRVKPEKGSTLTFPTT